MNPAIEMHIVTVLSILSFKLTVLVIGFLITYLGYKLLVMGVRAEFKFKGDFTGIKADLVSASPGLLFLLLGIILMGLGILKDKPFSTSLEQSKQLSSSEESFELSPLPSKPPGTR